MKDYDAIVFIGRFQPFHNAHNEIINRALEKTDKLILIIGSADEPRTHDKNPFTVNERINIIKDHYYDGHLSSKQIYFGSTYDTIYNNDSWALRVQKIVYEIVSPNSKIAIIGHKKDESSFYLDMFPQWSLIETPLLDNISATDIRNIYFQETLPLDYIASVVPTETLDFLRKFKETEDYNNLIEERRFIEQYKNQYASYPYPPTFVTVDAVVVQSGHLLMVKRRASPGRGLWALPGGFLDANNDPSLKHAMVRELMEETGLKIPENVLNGSIKKCEVFDAVKRSSRGRTITHAFYIHLNDLMPLPRVKGSSDAEKAQWIPFSQIKKSDCFEDHWEIINIMLGFTFV